jgi:hypothetical protein
VRRSFVYGLENNFDEAEDLLAASISTGGRVRPVP